MLFFIQYEAEVITRDRRGTALWWGGGRGGEERRGEKERWGREALVAKL